ncbi:MAG: hypothetical protein NC127_03195 [Muribaculum sp.]|nr:hypothetical protein [Muribaculum sp.]
MRKNILLAIIAMILSTTVWSCSDDEDKVNAMFTELEYRHIDIEKLPQPVQGRAKEIGSALQYILNGSYNGQEAYMLKSAISYSPWGSVFYVDGTEVPSEDVGKGVKSGVFDKWVCIYHRSRDAKLSD